MGQADLQWTASPHTPVIARVQEQGVKPKMRHSQKKLELLTRNQMSAAMDECCAEPGDVLSALRGLHIPAEEAERGSNNCDRATGVLQQAETGEPSAVRLRKVYMKVPLSCWVNRCSLGRGRNAGILGGQHACTRYGATCSNLRRSCMTGQ